MKPEGVLDASAVLALVRREPGWERVAAVIADSLVSVVNEAEVITQLIRRGQTAAQAQDVVLHLAYRLVDLNSDLARRAGALAETTRSRGLSLGDRCCLALAEREDLPAFTADSAWTDLPLPIDIRMIRQTR